MRDLRECRHVRTKLRKLDVFDQLEQPALMVNQQHDGVFGIDHPPVELGHDFLLKKNK